MIVPAGLKLPGVSGLPLGSRMSDWGYAAGWRMVRAMPEFAARNVFDAAALYASRNGGPAQLRKNLARVIGVAPNGAAGPRKGPAAKEPRAAVDATCATTRWEL